MKKILIIITTDYVPYGGLTTVMMNYYRAMNKSDLQIDFASTNEAPRELIDELHADGSKYYCLGNRKKNYLNYQHNLKKLLNANKYDVIHVNGNSATMLIELFTAKKTGVPVRIAHGHTTQTTYPLINKMLRRAFEKSYTCSMAVSRLAGDWLYRGKQFIVLNNAIDLNKYKFEEKTRNRVRAELKVEEKFVVGDVGKLNKGKNQRFLLEIFAEFKKRKKNVCLLLVGGGELKVFLEEECRRLNIKDDVIFTGMVSNTARYLQAMDVFVFPSLYEGLGMAVIEAQASGLPCIASDKVPIDTKVSDNIEYLNLEQSPEQWADHILQYAACCDNRSNMSELASESIRTCGYDIEQEADKLRKIYMQ